MTDQELIDRASKVYMRQPGVECPSQWSEIEYQNGKKYVVLQNGYRVLGVWLVSKDDKIRRLKVYPACLEKS